jgi:hypothetical protein
MASKYRLSLCLAAGLLATAAAPPAPPLTVAPGELVDAIVDGHKLRFAVQANGLSYPVLNPDAAKAAGFKPGLFAAAAGVGPIKVPGYSTVARLHLGAGDGKRRMLWFDRAFAPRADGSLGPGAVPQPVVSFRLRPSVADERRVALPMTAQNGGLGTLVSANGRAIFVTWDLERPASLATAAAGQALAGDTGHLEGAPMREPIRFGIDRPARWLALAQPFAVGPLRIARLKVRTTDYGDTSRIADADQDPGEIVVSGKSERRKSQSWLAIGAADMANCSTLTFDKPAKQIILSCRP